jgi:hypothetical protein
MSKFKENYKKEEKFAKIGRLINVRGLGSMEPPKKLHTLIGKFFVTFSLLIHYSPMHHEG